MEIKHLLKYLNGKQLYISVITELELLGFKGISKKEEKAINEFVSQCKIININNEIKKETVNIRKNYNTKLPDSIIIATALHIDLALITSDTEFKKVSELTLIHYEK